MAAALVATLTVLGMSSAQAAPQVEGVIRLLAADTVDRSADPVQFRGRSEDIYQQVLVVGDRSYFLKGQQGRPNTRVRVVGQAVGREFRATSLTTLGDAPAGIPSSGTTRVLVMLAHWSSPDSVTQASAHAQMFTDSNGWYRDASYTMLGQTGDTTPWMRIAGPTTGCFADHMALMDQAKSAATGLGYNMANYDNFVLYFPTCGGDAAGFAGWAYVDWTGTWLNGFMDRRVTVHEEGHNYGLYHAHSQMCSSGGLSGSCTFSDYGDPYDAMGSSGNVGHFSGPAKTILGWMGSGRTVDLTAGGSTTLLPMAVDSAGVRAAVVTASSSRKYWLEYRQAVDFDGWLPASGTDGVLVHVEGSGCDGGDTGACLIDVRPGDGIDVTTSTLRSGQSWTSPEGFTFTVGSVSSTGASVTVSTVPSCSDAFEPNNTTAQARTFPVGTTQRHAFCVAGDQDWVTFAASPDYSYRLETLNLSSGTDTVLELYGTDGTTLIASNDDTTGLASLINFRPTASGTYYLKSQQFGGTGSPAFAYDLRITRTAPELLRNPGFELDANADTRPDSWTSDARFTRSSTVRYAGTYSGRHLATDNSGHTIAQTVSTPLTAGASYRLTGRVNIPATSDAFTYSLQIRWLNSLGTAISTETVKSYTAATAGWNLADATKVAPTGAVRGQVRLVASSLNATIYVDALSFRRR